VGARECAGTSRAGLALDSAAFPHMTMREADIGASGAHFPVSFSGELSYEINVPADQGLELWERLIAVGELFASRPTARRQCMSCAPRRATSSRQETDGSVTPVDVGFGALVARD